MYHSAAVAIVRDRFLPATSATAMHSVAMPPGELCRWVATLTLLGASAAGFAGEPEAAGFASLGAAALHAAAHIFATAWHVRAHWRTAGAAVWCALTAVLLVVLPEDGEGVLPTTLSVLGVLVALPTLLALWLFPVPGTARLPGPHMCVGTTTVNLPHPEDGPGCVLPVQVWFPARQRTARAGRLCGANGAVLWTSGHPTHQLTEARMLLAEVAKMAGLPELIFSHLALARSNAVWVDSSEVAASLDSHGQQATVHSKPGAGGIVPEPRKFKMALYSHGKFGWRQLDSRCCEALASQGCVVFAVDHAPDGALSRPLGLHNQAQCANFTVEEGASDEREQAYYQVGINRRVKELQHVLDCARRAQGPAGAGQEREGQGQPPRLPFHCGLVDTANVAVWGQCPAPFHMPMPHVCTLACTTTTTTTTTTRVF